jgi:hypothetical protein
MECMGQEKNIANLLVKPDGKITYGRSCIRWEDVYYNGRTWN